MRRQRGASGRPSWVDADVPDPRCKLLEEQVEMREHRKRLCDCELPEGFRLLHSEPKMLRMESQMRWAFCLVWAERGKDLFFFPFRYEIAIPDETQLGWALDDFTAELIAAGVSVQREQARAA